MSRQLISGNNIVSFNPLNGVVVVKGYVQLNTLLLVNNATKNISLFNFSDPNTLATLTYNSQNNTTSIDVSYNTTSMSSSDKIQVFYEKTELEIQPTRTYRDPVSKFRVSTPTTLIDTDFEYGPQPTKWEAIKLINNIPTSYSSTFTENSIAIVSIVVSAGNNIMTVNTKTQHNLQVGGVVEINSLSDSQYEGTFIVTKSASTSFSVKLPFNSSKSGDLSTIYTTAYKGAFYTGSLVQVNNAITSTGSASTITIETPNIHGLNNNTKLYLKNSRATKKTTFNVPTDVVGIGTTYYKSVINGLGESPEIEYYAKNKIITEEIIGKSEINILDTAINTSTGQITYNNSNQNGQIVNTGISTDDVVVYYTPAGNASIERPGTPSSTNVLNFTPFRVLSTTSQSGITTFTINDAFSTSLQLILSTDGSILYGNHRFIKAYRIISFTAPYTLRFNKPVDFVGDGSERIIINTNFTTTEASHYESTTGSYITRDNGEYDTSSRPYYVYTVSSVSLDKLSITVSATWGAFATRNVATLNSDKIWCASSIIDHPLSNSLYLAPSVGFSTSRYEDYQYVLYNSLNNQTNILPLVNNTNYILQNVSGRPNWYRIYNAQNTSDTSPNWSTPINLYYNRTGNNKVQDVLPMGIQTITSALSIKNTNTISIPQRGGLENNSIVVYNTSVTAIGNLTPNTNYRVKTEDTSLSSNTFRLSTSTETVRLYGVLYTVDSAFCDFDVYDLKDRTAADLNAEDGIKSAGISVGNIIQIFGSNYSNPIKKNFINNSFKISNITDPGISVKKEDANSPATTRRYIYRVKVEVPTDGTFNRKTGININITSTPTALNTAKSNSIIALNVNSSGMNGQHILSQNVDGAADDIYTLQNTQDSSFQFNTSSEIPEITKNISPFQSSSIGPINFNTVGPTFAVTGNIVTSSNTAFTWYSVTTTETYTAPISISFQLDEGDPYYFSVGLTDRTTSLTTLNYSLGYSIFQYRRTSFGGYRGTYTKGIGQGFIESDTNANHVYTITYTIEGKIIYYKNGVQIDSQDIGVGKSLRPFVSNAYIYSGGSMSGRNIQLGGRGVIFNANVTNYLKISSHNFTDGTEVTYNVSPNTEQAILPLVHNTKYYTRVLDSNFIGLSLNQDAAIDRSEQLIAFSTTGSSSASHSLITNSIKGYLHGSGSVGITSTSVSITGNNSSFLTDYTNGDTFRIYSLDINGNKPGDYFESKIVSIKSDTSMKLEDIPTFTKTNAGYFKETGLYAISEGKVAHRPFDGGVAMYTGLIPNTKIIRQTRKYFRYQSGKGIQVSMAVNFNPTYDIDLISKVGAGVTSYFNVRTKFSHKLSKNSPNSIQRIIFSNVSGSISNLFNRTNEENGFEIKSIVDDFNFVVDIGNQTGSSDITGFPQYNIKNWQDSAVRCGLYDDQNGFFFEYDGTDLYVVRRSATQQLSGQFQSERNKYLITGVNSNLKTQVFKNDSIVIRGQTYKVISVIDDNTLSIQPAYRGNSSSNIIISKVIDTKIPQSQWNIDIMDGTGETGYKIDIAKIQMIYLDYSWYGAGSGRFGFKDQRGEVKYAHEFIHNNVFTESYFRSGNLPARYEVETFDDPLYSPSLFHWGVSVIMDGGYDDDKAYLFTANSDTLPFTNDGYSSTFTGVVNSGSSTISDITATEYSQLVIGEELVQTNYTHIERGTKILTLSTDPAFKIAGIGQKYLMTISKPAISGTNTNISLNAFSGTSGDIQTNIPLVSIRLAPSVDNGNVGNLGFRDIINRMQLTLKSAGVLTTHDCEVKLILNGQLSEEVFERVTSPSLSQIYKHKIGERISEGITVFSFRAQGGDTLIPSTTAGQIGRRSLSSTEVSLEELALLGNSIIGGDGTFPDGPDILTLVVKPIDNSTISGGSPMIVSGRITWTEAQA